jgi:hypothetical protein
MEVTRIADLPPELYEMAQSTRIELYFVNSFTKIQKAFPNGSGALTEPKPGRGPMITIRR